MIIRAFIHTYHKIISDLLYICNTICCSNMAFDLFPVVKELARMLDGKNRDKRIKMTLR